MTTRRQNIPVVLRLPCRVAIACVLAFACACLVPVFVFGRAYAYFNDVTDSYPAEQGFVPEKIFLERLPSIAANALLDACTGSNPRQPTQEEMERLLKCCYYDLEVDF